MDAQRLSAFRCLGCGRVMFPGRRRCPRCKRSGFEEVELTGGRIITHTTLTATRPGFPTPLTLAVVEFDNGARMLAQIRGGQPRVGARVKPDFGELTSGETPVRGFRFTPVVAEEARGAGRRE